MEIKIDTKKDSPEDIRKAIELLRKIVEASTERSEFITGGDVAGGMSSMFGDTPVLGTAPDSPDDDESKDEEEKENIEIISY